jgi:hypothetical protein
MNSRLQNFLDTYWILLALILIKMVLQYVVVNPVYELHRDEFLYLNQADHLAFGYISVPPLMAVISKIVFLLGDGIFWVRFFPALFGALTVVFVWLTVEATGGRLFAKILSSAALIFSALLRINILYQPNSFDIFIWTIIFYLIIRFIQTEKNSLLYWLAIIIAAGFYNKYNVVFLIAGLAVGLLVTYQRRIFLRPSFWIAMTISLIILMPNILWQITNHFPVFQHMKVLKINQLDNNSAGGFLKSQLFFFFGSLPLTLAALGAFFFYKPFRQFMFIGITFIVVLALFAIMKAKDYYAVGIYPVMIAFGSNYFESVLPKKLKNIVLPGLIAINLIVFILTLNVVFPVYSPEKIRENAASFERLGMLRWEDGKNHNLPQDFADMLGWKEMASKSLEAFRMIPPAQLGNTLVICNNYGQAGAINYFNRTKMAEAYAFNTDYIYWLPRLERIDNVLLIGQKPSDEIIALFREIKQTGSVENQYARESGTGIFLLTGANGSFTNVFYNLVEERKRKLDIF